MDSLAGRTAVLTGATGGIGPHIARALSREGMNLVLAARSTAALEAVAEGVRVQGGRAVAVPTDVKDLEALESLVDRTHREFGAVDVLVNNAAIDRTSPYEKQPCEFIQAAVQVNLLGPLLLTRLVLPGMLDRGRGHIVNISSLAGKAGPPHGECYAATKAALITFTESLRLEYRGTGVSASVICPGFVEAGLYERARKLGAPPAPMILGTSSPESVARAVVDAIKRDTPETILGRRFTRLLVTLGEVSPPLAERIMERYGMSDWYRAVARRQNK